MKAVNLFTSNLQGKALVSEKAASRKAVHSSLQDFAKAIDGAFNAVIKSDDKRARNVANAAKGKYQTALAVVANCYPYQTNDGVLLCKKSVTDANGEPIGKIWSEKKLTAAAARGIVRAALDNFIKGVGVAVVENHAIGEAVAAKSE